LVRAIWLWPALAAIVLLALLAARSGTGPDLSAHLAHGSLSDIGLYQAIARMVGSGADYYATAVTLQRDNGFPLQPFVTVRLPTLAWITGAIGEGPALALAVALVLANAAIWFAALPFARPAERVCLVALVILASLMTPRAVYLHEWWAGQLLTGALGLFLRRQAGAALALAVAALFVRELSALFLLTLLPFLLRREQRTHLRAALLALAVFGIALLAHHAAVTALVLPGDPVSPGWLDLRGPAGPSADLQTMVLFGLVPEPWASLLVFAPLLGWCHVAARRSALPLFWFAGFLGVLAVLARADNAFWVRMILPAYMAGLALVPRALAGLPYPAISRRTAPGGGPAGSPAGGG